jgi:hypothetical protein
VKSWFGTNIHLFQSDLPSWSCDHPCQSCFGCCCWNNTTNTNRLLNAPTASYDHENLSWTAPVHDWNSRKNNLSWISTSGVINVFLQRHVKTSYYLCINFTTRLWYLPLPTGTSLWCYRYLVLLSTASTTSTSLVLSCTCTACNGTSCSAISTILVPPFYWWVSRSTRWIFCCNRAFL